MQQYNPYQRYATRTVVSDTSAIGNAMSKAFASYRQKQQKLPQASQPKRTFPVALKFKPGM